MDKAALQSVLRIAEKHCGAAAVRQWLSDYLSPHHASSSSHHNGAAGQEKNNSINTNNGSNTNGLVGRQPVSSRPSSRRGSPTERVGEKTPSASRKTSPVKVTSAKKAAAASRTSSAAPPPRSVNALRSNANTSSGGGVGSAVVASRRTASSSAARARAVSKGATASAAVEAGTAAYSRSNTSTSAAGAPPAPFQQQHSSSGGAAFSRASSTGRTASAPRVHTPTNERPTVVTNAALATRVARQAPPSATSYRSSAAAANSNRSGLALNSNAHHSSGNVNGNSGMSTTHRSVSADVPQRGGSVSASVVGRSAGASSSAGAAGGVTIASRRGAATSTASAAAAGGRLREAWAAEVTAAARSLGSLTVHSAARLESILALQHVLEAGNEELVRHALNSEDFFCVTCGKLMPLLNHQLQSLSPELVGPIAAVVDLIADAMGPLFAPVMDTYYCRLLWLLDCPAMAPIYEELAAHAVRLVERVRHERMLCHLIDHIRWIDRKGDPLPHAIEVSPQLSAAAKATSSQQQQQDKGAAAALRERSKRMCVTLSFQLLELTVRRCCAKVQFSIDEMVHPNEYTLPYLDDLYCSDSQRAEGLPLFVTGGGGGGRADGPSSASSPASASSGGGGGEVSCIVEILRRSIAKREGVDPRLVSIHALPSFIDLEDGEDVYDFGRHPLLKAYEFIAQHTGKGLHDVTRDAVIGTTTTASAANSPTRGGGGGATTRHSVNNGDGSDSPLLSQTARLLQNPSLHALMASGVGVSSSGASASSNADLLGGATPSRTASQARIAVPSLDAVAKYNVTASSAINPLDTAKAMFHLNAAPTDAPPPAATTSGAISRTTSSLSAGAAAAVASSSDPNNPHSHHTTAAPSSSCTNEVTADADALARTITNDDFKHKIGRQSIERMLFVTAVAKRIWDTLILPIVGDATRPSTALPHAHHIFEGFLMLFPIHGALLMARDVAIEQRRLITRRLLDKTLRHMYNFPFFMRVLLDDLSAEEVGGPLGSAATVTPMVDSPPTRLGQMNLRQARGAGRGTTLGGGSAAASRRAASAVGAVGVFGNGGAPLSRASSMGGRSGTSAAMSIMGGGGGGSAASLMTADARAASPNLFAMMGHVPNPEKSRIALRAPSPRVGTASVAGAGGGPSASSAASAVGCAAPSTAFGSPNRSAYGGGNSAASASAEPFHRSVSARSSGAAGGGGGETIRGISLSTLARIADPHGAHGTIRIKTPRGGSAAGTVTRAGPRTTTAASSAHSAGAASPIPSAAPTAFPSALAGGVGSATKPKGAAVVRIIEDGHRGAPSRSAHADPQAV